MIILEILGVIWLTSGLWVFIKEFTGVNYYKTIKAMYSYSDKTKRDNECYTYLMRGDLAGKLIALTVCLLAGVFAAMTVVLLNDK